MPYVPKCDVSPNLDGRCCGFPRACGGSMRGASQIRENWLDLRRAGHIRQLPTDQHQRVQSQLVVVRKAQTPLRVDHLEVSDGSPVVGWCLEWRNDDRDLAWLRVRYGHVARRCDQPRSGHRALAFQLSFVPSHRSAVTSEA